MKKRLLWLMFICVLPACGSSSSELNSVKIFSAQNQKQLGKFKVEIADTPDERSMGLMYRQEMAQDHGMIFIYTENIQSAFWMKNTLIALDMIFIGADKKIVSIVEDAEPQTETPRYPAGPYRYVLEVNGGVSEKLGIKAGDMVEFNLP